MSFLTIALSLTGAFFCGSIPFGYLIGLWNGHDLRKEGSGNIGATNVWRVLGPKWGAPAFLLDFLKGWGPVVLVSFVLRHQEGPHQLLLVGTALAAILGHNYTPWLGFKGGKGIATSAGVLTSLLPLSLLVIVVVWLMVFLPFRIVSLASLAASLALPLGTLYFYPGHPPLLIFSILACLLSIWRHRSNIGRLLQGTEPKLGRKTTASAPAEKR